MTFAALETPLVEDLDPAIYVEPKDGRGESEFKRQRELVNHVRKHAKKIVVFAVPNSARTEREKFRQHGEGALYGASDLVFLWAGGVAFIEMKNGKEMPRPNQIAFLNAVHARGHAVAVCRTLEGALRFLWSINAPISVFR